MLRSVPLFALVLHAWDFDRLAISHSGCEMVTGAVQTKLVPTLERKEVFLSVVFIARAAVLASFTDWLGADTVKVGRLHD